MKLDSGRGLPRRVRASLALLLAIFFAIPAVAQGTRPPASQAILTDIQLIGQSDQDAEFRLVFAPKANGYAPVGTDTRRPSLGFGLTVRGQRAVAPSGLKGLVRQIDFDQADTVLILRFATTRDAAIVAKPIDDKAIDVKISINTPANAPGLATTPAVANAPLGAAYQPGAGDTFELVQLKYADVSEIVGLLSQGATVKSNDLFVPREPAFGSNSLTGNSYNPGPSSQAPGSDSDPLGQGIDSGMAIDRRLNAIWLRGSPDYIARMKAMINAIDIPLDSVILETQFIELTESASKAIGIDFTNANGQIFAGTLTSGSFIPIGETPSNGGHFNPNGDLVGGRLTSAQVQAAVYAQITKGNGRIVSKPRIAAQSGSTAKIITGDALPILTAITLSGVNGVSQQVQYVNVGVTLQIAPRVSADGYVSSHVFAVVSSVTGYSQGYPTISQREAETSATVRDGDSFVIGGLTQEDELNTRVKVPLLGDIPILGRVFGTDRKSKTKTELFIIVTPHIVRRVPQATAPVVQ
ncbi:secretin N-terminal domain-containing protein [Sphingomonas sp. ASV193]|uniref:secretin N-terminal domain-containing protein n=1 Tax=Sphingomonas sp. ASV193 TaxID=3144405 RepID=UPI0032E8C6AF